MKIKSLGLKCKIKDFFDLGVCEAGRLALSPGGVFQLKACRHNTPGRPIGFGHTGSKSRFLALSCHIIGAGAQRLKEISLELLGCNPPNTELGCPQTIAAIIRNEVQYLPHTKAFHVARVLVNYLRIEAAQRAKTATYSLTINCFVGVTLVCNTFPSVHAIVGMVYLIRTKLPACS